MPAQHGSRADGCAPHTTSIITYERADGSLGRLFVGACDTVDRYAQAVLTAVTEARRDNGRNVVVSVVNTKTGEILSACYAREAGL